MRFEVFTVLKIKVEFPWAVMLCIDVVGYQHVRNTGILPQHYMVSQPRRTQPEVFWFRLF